MFSLPGALLSIVVVLYFAFFLTKNIFVYAYEKVVWFSVVGIPTFSNTFSFDWFFLNTDLLALIVYSSIIIFVAILFLSIFHSRERFALKRSELWFVLLYGFIAPLWMMKAVFRVFFSKGVPWR